LNPELCGSSNDNDVAENATHVILAFVEIVDG